MSACLQVQLVWYCKRAIHRDQTIFAQLGAQFPQVLLLHAEEESKIFRMEYRVDEERIDYENMASLIESPDHGPDESIGKIHPRGD
jgi:hypothetical protein